MRKEIIEEHHDRKGAGHFAVMKTHEKLRMSRYYWLEMRKSVEKWINSCEICQWTKPEIRKEVAPLGKCMAGEPMERIAIDVMGPLPETERGNKFIVVIGDYFTKWTEDLPQSITEDQKNWDIQIPLCCMAYRAAVDETTRKTPNFPC